MSEDEFSDDLITNNRIIELFKVCNKYYREEKKASFESMFYWFKELFKFRYISKESFCKRIKKNFLRQFNNFSRPSLFYYLSCKNNEEKSFNNIVGTYKELFCNICFEFHCNIHGTSSKEFDSKDSYDIKDYYTTLQRLMGNIHKINLRDEWPAQYNSLLKDVDTLLIQKNIKNKTKITKPKIKELSKNGNNTVKITHKGLISHTYCSQFCYKNLNSLSKSAVTNLFSKYFLKDFQIGNSIQTLYMLKLFSLFKFDPCLILKVLNIFLNITEIECTLIAFYLINNIMKMEELLPYYKLYKKALYFNKKNTGKQVKISKQRLENINEQIKNSNIKYII
jgi:hypothetical protein